MSEKTFLQQVAEEILKNYASDLNALYVILPNKRAKIFLLNELKNLTTTTIFAPEIISIEEFIQDLSGIRSIDSIELLFQFYEIYQQIPEETKDDFDRFANWAKTLLQDFNEIDRYLLDAHKILKYVEDIKEVEHWSKKIENKTELIEKHLAFWKKLPKYYDELYQHLLSQNIGYQGLIYREAVKSLIHFSENNTNKKFLFAGFNALNKAEEQIIQHLLATGSAKIFWDIDEQFMNDSFHDAGLFQRKTKTSWNYYKSNPYEWIANSYQHPKNIHIINTSKLIGQAKIAGKIIESQARSGNLQHTALILGDENLLLPVLHSLPKEVNALNVTMGFSSKNNPSQLLLQKLFKLHIGAISRNEKQYVFYYKEVLDILTHPLVEPYLNATNLVNQINQNNFTFITRQKLGEFYQQENSFFNLLFDPWNKSELVLKTLTDILLTIKSKLDYNKEEEKLANAFLYAIYKTVNKLESSLKNKAILSLKTLHAIYKQVIELAEVSFEGEPLEGLQIMGILESRTLDFETVIITSVNEGKLPAGKTNNSFIPYDVKLHYGLPTFKEKDAIYTFHFYHLLQRAKNIYLLYNSDTEGFESGEKSRFITQLEVEHLPQHQLFFNSFYPEIPSFFNTPMIISKNDSILKRIKEIASGKGFSPSSLTTYIRNPIQFYYQRILRISDTEEVEENIAVNTLGTIIHGVLETLFTPFIGKELTLNMIESCFPLVENEVLTQFKLVYKEGEIKKGKNLLAYEVAKRNIINFLNLEIDALKKGDIVEIIGLETALETELIDNQLPFPVKIAGKVDRIEIRNNQLRIIDYKTGKVSKNDIRLESWSGLTENIAHDKIIQLLAYALMYCKEQKQLPIVAGIISFKNLKEGFMPFKFGTLKEAESLISPEVLDSYQEQLITLLKEIIDIEIPFTEKTI